MVVAREDDEDEDDVATTERERTARIAKGAYKIMQRHGFYPFKSYVFQLEKWSKMVQNPPLSARAEARDGVLFSL